MQTAALAAIAVLQGFAGRWWLTVLVGALAALGAGGAWVSWSLARSAEPWQEPTVSRPARWVLWVYGAACAVDLLLAVGEFADARPLDGLSWLFVAVFMWVAFNRAREQRRLTEPVKTPARPGHPGEWL